MYKQLNQIDINGNIVGISNIILREDGAQIPSDPANTDYQAFLLWKSEGNEPIPADE
jgi:hypothetical protein